MTKGRWFPGWRTAAKEQCQAYRKACMDLFRNTRYESAAGIRVETQRYLDLHNRIYAAERPLTRTQQSWHWHRALTAEDKDFIRLQRTADKQRPARAARKSR